MRDMKFLVVFLGLLASSVSLAAAQSGSGPDEQQIRAVVQGQTDAWNKGDAQAFAARYAEDGSFTNVIGQQIYGRQGFIDQHAKIFSTIYKDSHNSFVVGKIKFVRPDVAVVDIDGVLSGAKHFPPGLTPMPDGSMHVKLQEVMTKEKDGWWIASFHNVAIVALPPQMQ